MTRATTRLRRTMIISGLFMLLAGAALRAQTPGDTTDSWASWWFGLYGGVNYDMFSGQLRGFNPAVVPNSMMESGSGLGPTFGGVIEYNPGSLLGFTMMLGYDARPVDFDSVSTLAANDLSNVETLSTSLSYFSIEPSLRINLGNRFFHLLLGPTFGINLGKGKAYTLRDTAGVTTTDNTDLQNVRGFAIGAQGGIGYDIPLAGESSSTQIVLTPFVQFHLGLQNLLDNPGAVSTDPVFNDFKMNTIRAGLQLKFGSRPTPPVITDPDGEPIVYDFRVDAPLVVAESRRVEETFPLRNYIFFEPGTTAIPARYAKLSKGDAGAFREEQLLKLDVAETGSSDKERSVRQMRVYYNVLNVFGDRLRRNPAAKITLTGSANGDATKGKEMAENVKSYLVQSFGIGGERITTVGQAMPPHKSGSGGSMGEDETRIDAENWRVEISSEPESILQPVEIVTLEEEPIGNDVIFRLNSDDNVASVSIAVDERDGGTRTFGPYSGDDDVRIDARDLLGADREGRYTATTTYTLKNGETYKTTGKEFRLVRADPDEEQTGVRYSILFEFDQSKTVQTYEQFLRETVAPAIPNGATVIIHGHTDVIGKPEYNNDLASKRVDETRRVLTDALTTMGRKVTFDSHGFGEDEARAPFANGLPEQRYYNRTVIVEIVPGG